MKKSTRKTIKEICLRTEKIRNGKYKKENRNRE